MHIVLFLIFSTVFDGEQAPVASWENLSKLAAERQAADDFAGAEALRRKALRAAEESLPEGDKFLAAPLSDLALTLHFEGKFAEAEPLARRAYAIAAKSGDSVLSAVTLNAVGAVLLGAGELARAEPVLRRSLAMIAEAEGTDCLDYAKASNNLATLYTREHEYVKAEKEMARSLEISEKHLGRNNPQIAIVLSNMSAILSAEHRAAEGEPYLRRALAIAEQAFPHGLRMAAIEHNLAVLEASRGNDREAVRLYRKVIAIEEDLLGPDSPPLAQSLKNYSLALKRLHRNEEAKQAQTRAAMILKTIR